jgi:hypothetical protein
MLEIMQFYVSGFWIWLGLTIGLGIVCSLILRLVLGMATAITGRSIHFGGD